jgi:hypothetical protein
MYESRYGSVQQRTTVSALTVPREPLSKIVARVHILGLSTGDEDSCRAADKLNGVIRASEI